ncbi:MAG: hypothetical protein FWG39_02550, partial [Alphaproteobacteria bacterium]|nr:hypothetical protein [Alphaproteobacteria bacterium]
VPYTLNWLEDYLDLHPYKDKRVHLPPERWGRNCILFETVRKWAYKEFVKGGFLHGDFFENKFESDFADAIATDPPWGLHMEIGPDFYTRAMNEFARILKPGGRLVILSARETDVPAHPSLCPAGQYNVLIHGRKATLRIFSKCA